MKLSIMLLCKTLIYKVPFSLNIQNKLSHNVDRGYTSLKQMAKKRKKIKLLEADNFGQI